MGSDGVLLITAWVEQGSAEPLRARVQATVGVPPASAAQQEIVAGVGEVVEAVRAWLHEVLAAG
jgi:Tfp pilus assembly protein PilN